MEKGGSSMEKFSRRHLFRYAAGAMSTGVAFGSFPEVFAQERAAFGSAFTKSSASAIGAGSVLNPVSSGLEAAGDAYDLSSHGSTRKSFGIVKNFFEHIDKRSDVKREILYWLTDGRASFLGASSRFQFLEPTIRPMYEKAGIPMEFGFGLGMQESLFRNYSVSYANARGIWQMQWAGQRYGLRGGDYFDVVKSTEKQLEYLSDLVRIFDWNLELVLVDYNYGPGSRYARYRSDPNAFERISHRLPGQTRRFVPRILAAMAIGLAPERYGVFIPRLDTRTTEAEVPREVHHLELGLLLGADHWNLGNLNPRESIRIWFKPGERVRIPAVHEETYQERIDDHPLRAEFHEFVSDVYPIPGQNIKYTVRGGDNLIQIADRFKHCGVQGPEHIMLYNGLTSTIIHPGQELLIPCSD